MPRKPSVNYWPSKGGYGTTHKGVQTILAKGPDDAPLGPTYLRALDEFRRLLERGAAPTAAGGNKVETILDLYLAHLEARRSRKTVRMFRDIRRHAVPALGGLTVQELKPLHVQQFLNGRAAAGWGETYQFMALGNVKKALNWALKQGYITGHCLERRGAVEIAPARTRGREALISDDTFAQVLLRANDRLMDLVEFLHGTGCRPAEAYNVEARYYRRGEGCVVYPGHPAPGDYVWKSAKKTKKDRIIYLNPGLVRTSGPLFRNRLGARWNEKAVGCALGDLSKRIGLASNIMAYSFRHTYATDFIKAGGSIKFLAELLGTSVQQLERHYSHIDIDRVAMRNCMLAIMRKQIEAATV